MNQRWAIAANVIITIFASGVLIAQLTDISSKKFGLGSEMGLEAKSVMLSHTTNIVDREMLVRPSSGTDRYLDLILPENARVFMTGILGTTNSGKSGNYYYLVYYLFPREIGVSIGEPAHFTRNGIQGRAPKSNDEIFTNGYDVWVNLTERGTLDTDIRHGLPLHTLENPPWFDSWRDFLIAFILPLLTALSGTWLLRQLFPNFEQPHLEKLACGFGFGMMVVAALTLAIKLSGFHGNYAILTVTLIGSGAELWRNRKKISPAFRAFKKMPRRPVVLLAILFAGMIFLFLFYLAGLQGPIEFDAVANWALKAKIFHLCTGGEIVHWFSNPALAYAHMDYPTLVPALHAATYDSLGHINDFVTKFWPTWMLLFLLAALASLSGGKNASLYFLLGMLLLPMTLAYAQMEGGTMPMIFFATLGVAQCGAWAIEKKPARLALGLTLLFGAAMAKLEGFIFLAVTIGCTWLSPASRPPMQFLSHAWRTALFCLLCGLPFIILRERISTENFESGWAHYALSDPVATICSAPKVFLMALARLFVSPTLANWTGTNGEFHWTGQWNGLSSLIHHLGLGWTCLLLSVATWFAVPSRRGAVLWIFAIFIGAVAALSVVLASFVGLTGLDEVLSQRTLEGDSGRYLFPMLWAWAATLLTIYFFQPAEKPEAT